MKIYLLKLTTILGVVAALATGCGGGSGSAVVNNAPGSPADASATFGSAYSMSLAALTTAAGLQGNVLLDLVDSTFLDAGYTKAKMADNLTQDAASLSAASAVSLFPGVTLTNPAIACVGAAVICTFSGTITNSDADTTDTTFTTPVLFSNGAFRLLGDQAAS